MTLRNAHCPYTDTKNFKNSVWLYNSHFLSKVWCWCCIANATNRKNILLFIGVALIHLLSKFRILYSFTACLCMTLRGKTKNPKFKEKWFCFHLFFLCMSSYCSTFLKPKISTKNAGSLVGSEVHSFILTHSFHSLCFKAMMTICTSKNVIAR